MLTNRTPLDLTFITVVSAKCSRAAAVSPSLSSGLHFLKCFSLLLRVSNKIDKLLTFTRYVRVKNGYSLCGNTEMLACAGKNKGGQAANVEILFFKKDLLIFFVVLTFIIARQRISL